jgi:acyl carrier protein
MTHQQFYEQIGEILAIDVPLTGSETLIDLGWDSLSAVVFMAMADERCGVKVAPREMRGCSTVNDLKALVNENLENATDPERS